MPRAIRTRFIIVCVATIAAAEAKAQWSYAVLNPPGATSSHAESIADGQVAGWSQFGQTLPVAGVWNLSDLSWTQLSSVNSDATAAGGGTQVGWHDSYYGIRAALWNGAPGPVELNPVGISQSYAYATSGPQQAGIAWVGAGWHASLWSGTAASWVDLHPGGFDQSWALGVSDGIQVGRVQAPGYRASMWSGTAASWVDLSPAGSTESTARAVWHGEEGGEALFGGEPHAGLWHGSASSWIDLNPANAHQSSIYGVFAGFQSGFVWDNNAPVPYAAIWNGTAGSVENLEASMDPEWVNSRALGTWSDGATLYVVGWCQRYDIEGDFAIVWSRPIPSPSSAALIAGFIGAATLRRRRR